MHSSSKKEFRSLQEKTESQKTEKENIVSDDDDWEMESEEIVQPPSTEPIPDDVYSEEENIVSDDDDDWEMESEEIASTEPPPDDVHSEEEPPESEPSKPSWASDEESDVEEEDPPEPRKSDVPVLPTPAAPAPVVSKKKKEKKRRAPVAVVLGHVDSGKTLLLDSIRGTKVQCSEAGGITQQIGATNLPMSHIISRAPKCLQEKMSESACALPGLLVIDTPGHAVFANLRERGSSLCDTAVLVVNIMEGFQITTSQCLNMLLDKKVPFVIALNQVDRLDGWKPHPKLSIEKSLKKQSKRTKQHFKQMWKQVFCQFAEAEVNVALPWEGNPKKQVMVVPTSARTDCGVPDLLLLWTQLCARKKLAKKLLVSDKFKCKLLEVKQVKGHGNVVDVLVTSGSLAKGDTLVFCGMQGKPIVSKVRTLLVPKSVQDLRAKAAYRSVQEVHASCGVRVSCAESLEHAVAGSRVFKFDSQPRTAKDLTEQQVTKVQAGLKAISNVTRSPEGVYLVASTLGSLEALVEMLGSMNVPISGFSLGKVRKRDVMKACAMLHSAPEYAVLVAFDVEVDQKQRDLAQEEGLKVFHSDLYHQIETDVQDHFDAIREARREAYREEYGLPCRVVANHCYSKRKRQLTFAVDVELGTLETGTDLFTREPLTLRQTHNLLRRMFAADIPDKMISLIWEFLADTKLVINPIGQVISIMDPSRTAVEAAPVHSRVSVCLKAAPEARLLDLNVSENNPLCLYTRRRTMKEFHLLRELFPEYVKKKKDEKSKKKQKNSGANISRDEDMTGKKKPRKKR